MRGLVVFLYGLAGDRESWGSVPEHIRQSPLGVDFDVKTLDYNATIRSHSDIEKSAGRVRTEIETRFRDHEPIYMVGHSLGGLVAREVCRQLLTTGPDTLLNKISVVVTVGSPLEGARVGNRFLRCLSFISPKVGQIGDTKRAFDTYRTAIQQAELRKVNRPKHFHVQMEDDRVIASQISSHFTPDDYDGGIIPGSHTGFATADKDASYVADVILTLIRRAQNSLSRPQIISPEATSTASLPDRLVIIACSHGKRDGGNSFAGPEPAGWIPWPGLRQRVISKRSYVYGVLRDAKLADGFERGGNRAHQPANRNLRPGPDFGRIAVVDEGGQYLAARTRYNGRCYAPITEASWASYLQNRGRVRVLIMSGLYGLIEPEEWIQNYDVHLTDTHTENGQSVSSMWLELYTETLQAYVRNSHRQRKVHIFNFLCDRHYVDAVQWHKLPLECSVFHFASPVIDDVGLLPPAGTIVNSVLLDPDKLERIERDRLYDLSEFGTPPAGLSDLKIGFESRVGNLRSA